MFAPVTCANSFSFWPIHNSETTTVIQRPAAKNGLSADGPSPWCIFSTFLPLWLKMILWSEFLPILQMEVVQKQYPLLTEFPSVCSPYCQRRSSSCWKMEASREAGSSKPRLELGRWLTPPNSFSTGYPICAPTLYLTTEIHSTTTRERPKGIVRWNIWPCTASNAAVRFIYYLVLKFVFWFCPGATRQE